MRAEPASWKQRRSYFKLPLLVSVFFLSIFLALNRLIAVEDNATSLTSETDLAKASGKLSDAEKDNVKKNVPRPWYARVRMSGEFDSNVISRGDESLPSDISGEKDWGIPLSLVGGYRLYHSPNLIFWADCRYDSQYHKDLRDFDLQYLEPALRGVYRLAEKWLAGIRAAYSHAWVGQKYYDYEVILNPSITYLETDWANIRLAYALRRAEYFYAVSNSDMDRDGFTNSVQVTQNAQIPKTKLSISFGYQHNWTDSDGSDYDFDSGTAFFDFWHPFLFDTKMRGGISYAFSNYDNPNSRSDYAEVRDDDNLRLSIGLSKKIFKGLSGFTSYRFICSSSNIGVFQYRRHIVSLGVNYEF